MRFGDAARDRETESGAAPISGAALPEPVEDVRELRVIHSWPGVAHNNAHGIIPRNDFDANSTTFRCELHRIANEIAECLQQPTFVRLEHEPRSRALYAPHQMLRTRGCRVRLFDPFEQLVE
jgi:hypothetical protein